MTKQNDVLQVLNTKTYYTPKQIAEKVLKMKTKKYSERKFRYTHQDLYAILMNLIKNKMVVKKSKPYSVRKPNLKEKAKWL